MWRLCRLQQAVSGQLLAAAGPRVLSVGLAWLQRLDRGGRVTVGQAVEVHGSRAVVALNCQQAASLTICLHPHVAGGEGAERDLQQHPVAAGRPPDPHGFIWRIQGLLPEGEQGAPCVVAKDMGTLVWGLGASAQAGQGRPERRLRHNTLACDCF